MPNVNKILEFIHYIKLENTKLVEVICGFPGILRYFETLNGNYKYTEYSVDSINVFRQLTDINIIQFLSGTQWAIA